MSERKAGRELDEEIAIKIMGWKNDGTSKPWYPPGERVAAFDDAPRYSAYIAAAWQVLERVAGRKHWSFTIASQDGYDSGPLYYVTITNGNRRFEGHSLYVDDNDNRQDSLPLAICLAALAAIEGAKSHD